MKGAILVIACFILFHSKGVTQQIYPSDSLSEECTQLFKDGDTYFYLGKYYKARGYFKQALESGCDSSYAQSKIREIDAFLYMAYISEEEETPNNIEGCNNVLDVFVDETGNTVYERLDNKLTTDENTVVLKIVAKEWLSDLKISVRRKMEAAHSPQKVFNYALGELANDQIYDEKSYDIEGSDEFFQTLVLSMCENDIEFTYTTKDGKSGTCNYTIFREPVERFGRVWNRGMEKTHLFDENGNQIGIQQGVEIDDRYQKEDGIDYRYFEMVNPNPFPVKQTINFYQSYNVEIIEPSKDAEIINRIPRKDNKGNRIHYAFDRFRDFIIPPNGKLKFRLFLKQCQEAAYVATIRTIKTVKIDDADNPAGDTKNTENYLTCKINGKFYSFTDVNYEWTDYYSCYCLSGTYSSENLQLKLYSSSANGSFNLSSNSGKGRTSISLFHPTPYVWMESTSGELNISDKSGTISGSFRGTVNYHSTSYQITEGKFNISNSANGNSICGDEADRIIKKIRGWPCESS